MQIKQTDADYHANPAIGSTTTKTVALKNIAHLTVKQSAKRSPALDFGSAVHTCLVPERNLLIRGPTDRRGKKWTDAQDALGVDQILLTEADYDRADEAIQAVMRDPIMGPLISSPSTQKEQSVFVRCPRTELDLKVKFDAFGGTGSQGKTSVMFDLKTTAELTSPQQFLRSSFWKYGYAIQAAHYRYCMQIEGYKVDRFIFGVVQSTAPFSTHVFEMTDEAFEVGEAQMHLALEQIAQAKKTGNYEPKWPAVTPITKPLWME